jgi:hypothetical protein
MALRYHIVITIVGAVVDILAAVLFPIYLGAWNVVFCVVAGAVVVGILARSKQWLCGMAAAGVFNVTFLLLLWRVCAPFTDKAEMMLAWKSCVRDLFVPAMLSIIVSGLIAEIIGRAVVIRRQHARSSGNNIEGI